MRRRLSCRGSRDASGVTHQNGAICVNSELGTDGGWMRFVDIPTGVGIKLRKQYRKKLISVVFLLLFFQPVLSLRA
jgi:hypothetical protein